MSKLFVVGRREILEQHGKDFDLIFMKINDEPPLLHTFPYTDDG